MTRKLLFAVFIGIICIKATRQADPVQWSFSSKKIADKTYEVHLTATVAAPWHIYSQTTPEGGPVPSSITYSRNPLISFVGSAKEVGKLQQKYEDVFEVDVKYFSGKVDFVQIVKVSADVKTNLVGSIEFMVCNDQQCLPPKRIPFTVQLK